LIPDFAKLQISRFDLDFAAARAFFCLATKEAKMPKRKTFRRFERLSRNAMTFLRRKISLEGFSALRRPEPKGRIVRSEVKADPSAANRRSKIKITNSLSEAKASV
jgi:hypothetical protein